MIKWECQLACELALHVQRFRFDFGSFIVGLVDEIVAVCLAILRAKKKFFVSFAPFIILLAAFVAFVRWNGSVVLGTSRPYSLFNISSRELPFISTVSYSLPVLQVQKKLMRFLHILPRYFISVCFLLFLWLPYLSVLDEL